MGLNEETVKALLFDTGLILGAIYHFVVAALPTLVLFVGLGIALLQFRWWWLRNKQLNHELAQELAEKVVPPVIEKVIEVVKKEIKDV